MIIDSKGNPKPRITIESTEPFYWEKLEHQYAGMAMQGIVSNPSIELDYKGDEGCIHVVAIVAGKLAHALVEKMKEADR